MCYMMDADFLSYMLYMMEGEDLLDKDRTERLNSIHEKIKKHKKNYICKDDTLLLRRYCDAENLNYGTLTEAEKEYLLSCH